MCYVAVGVLRTYRKLLGQSAASRQSATSRQSARQVCDPKIATRVAAVQVVAYPPRSHHPSLLPPSSRNTALSIRLSLRASAAKRRSQRDKTASSNVNDTAPPGSTPTRTPSFTHVCGASLGTTSVVGTTRFIFLR